MSRDGGTVVGGNKSDGRLWSLGLGEYVGERPGRHGQFERRNFRGSKADVLREFQAWQGERTGEPREPPARERKERDMGTVSEAAKATGLPGRMFVLRFDGQRSHKDVALFADGDAALRMAAALEVALDATGAEGGYSVDELPVWGDAL